MGNKEIRNLKLFFLLRYFLTYHFLFVAGFVFGQDAVISKEEQLADSLIQQNRLLVSNQKTEEAIAVIEKAEKLVEQKRNATYGRCLYNHGRTYYYGAQYSKAIPFFIQALEVQKVDPGVQHGDYAYSLTGLANVYRELGRYEEAAPLYLKSKDIRAAFFGTEHPAYAGAINNLAILNWELGEFDKAEKLLLESKALREKLLGNEHPDFAASLSNLAVLYTDMGLFDKAEALYDRVIQIEEKTIGREHAQFIRTTQVLGHFYLKKGEYEKAKTLFVEGLPVIEKVLGTDNQEYAFYISTMADIYKQLKLYDQAEKYYRQALQIIDGLAVEENPKYAFVQTNLGDLYWQKGAYEKAVPLFEEGCQMMERFVGEDDLNYNNFRRGLAQVYEIEKRFDLSDELIQKIIASEVRRLNNASVFLSEKELTENTKLVETDLHRMFNFIYFRNKNGIDTKAMESQGYNHVLYFKGYLLNAIQRINKLSSVTPETVELKNQIKSYRRLLAREYAVSADRRDSAAVMELEDKVNTVEKSLARKVAEYDRFKKQVTWEDIRDNLEPDAAAVEFVHFPINFPHPTDSVLYGALLIQRGDSRPKFIPLFEESQLKDLINIDDGVENSNENSLLYASRGLTPKNRTPQAGIFELVWEPLEKLLHGSIEKIYYAPGGLLHQVSFDAISGRGGARLAAQYQLTRLGSTRTLAFAKEEKTAYNNKVVLYGGINYDLHKNAPDVFSYADSKPKSAFNAKRNKWKYLPGTKKEVENIAGILSQNGFSPQVFSNEAATEESFKLLDAEGNSPQIIHIATHGFFFPSTNRNQGGSEENLAFLSSRHPMMRSGLLLSGANYVWQTEKKYNSEMEDGILTAYEISQMNLSDTELVVLSACETGLGEILRNEGVYGLQRAFKIAGAKYVMMSLWEIPDNQTADLMREFYTCLIDKKLDAPDALRAAQKKFIDDKVPPFFWAGFVLLE